MTPVQGSTAAISPTRPGGDDPITHMAVREALGLRDGGLGILMAEGLVDELRYNDAGNEVQLVKYFSASAAVATPLALGGAT